MNTATGPQKSGEGCPGILGNWESHTQPTHTTLTAFMLREDLGRSEAFTTGWLATGSPQAKSEGWGRMTTDQHVQVLQHRANLQRLRLFLSSWNSRKFQTKHWLNTSKAFNSQNSNPWGRRKSNFHIVIFRCPAFSNNKNHKIYKDTEKYDPCQGKKNKWQKSRHSTY